MENLAESSHCFLYLSCKADLAGSCLFFYIACNSNVIGSSFCFSFNASSSDLMETCFFCLNCMLVKFSATLLSAAFSLHQSCTFRESFFLFLHCMWLELSEIVLLLFLYCIRLTSCKIQILFIHSIWLTPCEILILLLKHCI